MNEAFKPTKGTFLQVVNIKGSKEGKKDKEKVTRKKERQ